MEPTISSIERYDKLNSLLRVFLYWSQAGIPVENLGAMLFYLEPAEVNELCEQLLREGVICYMVGPFGLLLKLTEKGIEWILSGGYARQGRQPLTEPLARWANTRMGDRLLRYGVTGGICIVLLACCFCCR
ncbi:MAG: hypothetical protein P4L51_11125 [Puia sp.]|nr:hypothetical protein [Puia sp.]